MKDQMSDDKLKDLQKRIGDAQTDKEPEPPRPAASLEGMDTGMRILTELIGIMLASGVIGYFIDQWLDTAPGFFLGMLVLGIITFFYKMFKMTKKN